MILPYIHIPISIPTYYSSSQMVAEQIIEPVVPTIPFYSQFVDITSPEWKKIACGVTSLAMIIEYYEPGTVTPDALLTKGINSGAYIKNAGWSHQGLANLAAKYGLVGKTGDFTKLDKATALADIKEVLKDGPIIASVYYKMQPGHPIPHLVVINGIDGDTVYYNDPATKGTQTISTENFMKAWKKRFISVREPAPVLALK